MAGRMNAGQLAQLWKKYKYAVGVMIIGIMLMLLPTSAKKNAAKEQTAASRQESFSLEEMEEKMETTLGQIQGVGRLRVMLTLKNASEIQIAEDTDISREADGSYDSRRQPVTVNRGSGYQDVIITSQRYPNFQGAVVVCDGADDSAVQLAITNAVGVLTGLGSDRISVVKWQS